MEPSPDQTAPGTDGELDDPAAEAADPVNPDVPPDSPSGDEIYAAMLDENRSATGADEGEQPESSADSADVER